MTTPARRARLTDREIWVLEALAEGRTNADIATSLRISVHTLRSRLRQIYALLGVNGRTAAVSAAYRAGLLDPDAR